jgi:transcriptional regulator with XRE-family HTH domain
MRSGKIINPKILGNVLREARILNGLSQRKLAEQLGISQRAIVSIERGRPTKAVDRLFDFMRETNVTLYAELQD